MLKATGQGPSEDSTSIDIDLAESQPVVDDPALLRLVDLLPGDDRLTVSVAVAMPVSGIVVVHVPRQAQFGSRLSVTAEIPGQEQ